MNSKHTVLIIALMAACDDKDGSNPKGNGNSGIPEECQAMFACVEAINPEAVADLELVYGEGGECFTSDSETEEQLCIEACEEQVAGQSMVFPAEEACWAGGSPDAKYLFRMVPTEWEVEGDRGSDFADMTGDVAIQASTSGPDFEMNLGLSYGGHYVGEVTTTCTFTGRDFTCAEAEDGGTSWDISGSFDEAFQALDLQVTLSSDSGTDVIDMQGQEG